MKKPIVLRILKGDQVIGVKQFLDAQIVIGRQTDDSEVQVGLDGESVSIIHASIEERESGVYYVSDLGSSSGTLKNGETVLDASLNSGDLLNIGDYSIEFFIGAPRPRTGNTNPGLNVAPPSFSATTSVPPPPATTQEAARPAPPDRKSVPPPVVPGALPSQIPSQIPTPVPPRPLNMQTPASGPSARQQPASPPIVPVRPPTPGAPPAPQAAAQTLPKTPAPLNVKPPVPKPQQPAQTVRAQTSLTPAASVTPHGDPGTYRPPQPQAPLAGPRATRPGSRRPEAGAHRKKAPSFAPPGKYSDVREFVRPSKGTIVEVLVAWGERIISSHHFSTAGTFTIGSHPDNDIVVPLLSSRVRKLPLLQIDKQVVVLVTPETRGELIRGQTSSSLTELMRQNRLVKAGAGQAMSLEQGEMIRLEFGDSVSVLIRFVSDSPKPLVAPLLDLTASETTGVTLALALVATLWLYMYLYQAARPLPNEDDNQPIRTALIVLTPPTPPPLPKPPPQPEPTPPPQPVVQATPQPQKVKVAERTQETVKTKKAVEVTNLTKKVNNGKSASAAPNKNKTGPRIQTSVKQGGAIKTTSQEGAQMQSKSRDMSKSGVFSVFGNNGAQNKLSGSTTGSGELAGMASAATGKAGSAVDRAGEGLGSELKDTGAGGTGKSLEGIAGGVGTQGRGSGNEGYGTGGLGNRQGVKIVTGGTGEDIQGTIDKEAIRRVIQANLRSIRSCYEKELNKHPELVGKIVLTWEIGEQGRVLSTGTKSNELGSKEVADCVLSKLKTWRFPEPPANQVAEVAYPFFFSN